MCFLCRKSFLFKQEMHMPKIKNKKGSHLWKQGTGGSISENRAQLRGWEVAKESLDEEPSLVNVSGGDCLAVPWLVKGSARGTPCTFTTCVLEELLQYSHLQAILVLPLDLAWPFF